MCNAWWCCVEQIIVIPAQRHPHRSGEPATEPLVVDLTALIPAQRSSSPAVLDPVPNPVLVQQLAARSSTAVRPLIARVTAVIIGVGLVAVILVVLMVIR